MFGVAAEPEPDPKIESELLASLEEALEMLNQFRSREGARAGRVYPSSTTARSGRERGANGTDPLARPCRPSKAACPKNCRSCFGNTMLDPQRIAQEAALLADRSDIGEEISRLQIHSRQLNEILDAGGEVGKKLDFLLQEMNRETNTVLSKTNGIGELGLRITDLALAAKAAIEKIREQALNLE